MLRLTSIIIVNIAIIAFTALVFSESSYDIDEWFLILFIYSALIIVLTDLATTAKNIKESKQKNTKSIISLWIEMKSKEMQNRIDILNKNDTMK